MIPIKMAFENAQHLALISGEPLYLRVDKQKRWVMSVEQPSCYLTHWRVMPEGAIQAHVADATDYDYGGVLSISDLPDFV